MWDLKDENELDCAAKKKICEFCQRPLAVLLTRTAERDMALIPITKLGLLEGVQLHIERRKVVRADYMDNGDLAFIVQCEVSLQAIYVKIKFQGEASKERMYIISAHPPRRW